MVYALTWMPAVLREAGLNVVEIGGWQDRGHGNFSDVRGVLLHHTAGPASGNFPSQNVVVHGRPGLAGPLCNLGLGRDGTWFIVAAGLAYHAGAGFVSWCGRDNGNNHLIGIEAESTGRGDWTAAQHESYPRGVAALLDHVGLGADRALAHKEWAPGRKPDPAGWPGDMGGFRGSVTEWMEGDMPSAEEIAMAVWSHVLDSPQDPKSKHTAAMWLTYANIAAWKAADRPFPALDVDEDAIGRQVSAVVVQVLADRVASLSDADLDKVRAVIRDEDDRRARAGLTT